MAFGGTADLNWHHKQVVLVDLKWVDKPLVVHAEMRQFEEEKHQGKDPCVILTRQSEGKIDDILIVSGRAGGHVLVSLNKGDRLIARIDKNNPNSAGTVSWEIVC